MGISKICLSVVVGLCYLLFNSCAQFTPETLDKFSKGMSVAMTLEISPLSPTSEFTILIPSDPTAKVLIHVYVLSLGDYKSDYFLAFRNEKLVYWGYPHEFARSSDLYLNEIGKIAVDEYLKQK